MMVLDAEGLAVETREQSVADVMATDPVVLDPATSLEAADLALRSTFIHGIPVIDGEGKLVGVISHFDLASHRFGADDPNRPDD
jgi:CBS domain-containing protein